jgi:hypothetical protein
MWLKINKLSTLLYPQFSEGRTISDGGQNSVYMPFSQTIQASPLVRVRIGDLITSNYSKFNLARIFGYTYAGTKFDGKTLPPEDVSSLSQEFIDRKLKELKGKPGTTFKTQNTTQNPAPSQQLPGTSDQQISSPVGVSLEDLVLRVVKRDEKDGKIICKVEIPSGRDSAGLSGEKLRSLEDQFNNSNKPATQVVGKCYSFEESDLSPTVATGDMLKTEYAEDYSSAVAQFMRDDDPSVGNSIVRSFRSSGGKGLAGFIESMSFDWYDKVTWATDEGPGRKAPKMCKVNISFSPIHDITPGLDHMGANRAPIYSVKSSR